MNEGHHEDEGYGGRQALFESIILSSFLLYLLYQLIVFVSASLFPPESAYAIVAAFLKLTAFSVFAFYSHRGKKLPTLVCSVLMVVLGFYDVFLRALLMAYVPLIERLALIFLGLYFVFGGVYLFKMRGGKANAQ